MVFWMRVIAAVFAVSLQVQATLPLGASGVRVAASDLFLPIALIFVSRRFFTSPTNLQWRMPGVGWWLLGISLAMSIALGIGYWQFGQWSSWALLNKWGGWFALVSYFVIGGSIVRAGGTELRDEFLGTFLITAAIIGFVNSIAMPWLLSYYRPPFGIEYNRATGGMQNANAFGFLMVAAALLVLATQKRLYLYLPPLLTAIWFTASRGALLSLVIGALVYFMLSHRRWMSALKAAAMAILAIAVVMTFSMAVEPARLSQAKSGLAPAGFLSSERLDPEGATIKERAAQNELAVSLFTKAPIFGQGLGYFIETTGTTLHNSFL